jgi:flagellar basal-body rod modification protein FlgD
MNVNSTSNNSSSTPAAPTNQLGQQDFLKLLMAQLGSQDPLSPTDNTAFVAQLAQFSSLEAQQTTNSDLESMLVAQTAGNQVGAASLVGKNVLYSSSTVALTPGQPVTLYGNLSGPAATVTATVTDSTGKVVRTLTLGAEPQGIATVTWDGLDSQGNALPPGNYSVTFAAADATGKNVPVTTQARGLVNGVSFQNGYPELVIGTTLIKLSDVQEIDAA